MTHISIQAQILERLTTNLTALTWAKTVNAEIVRNLFTDFNEAELPAIQIFDRAPASIQPALRLINVQWPLSIELVLKSTNLHTYDQGELFDKQREIENLISSDLSLLVGGKIMGFQNLRYDGFETDLHSTPGFFATSLSFTALYSQQFPGCG